MTRDDGVISHLYTPEELEYGHMTEPLILCSHHPIFQIKQSNKGVGKDEITGQQ